MASRVSGGKSDPGAVRKAISQAEKVAGADDALFVKALKAQFSQPRQKGTRGLRAIPVIDAATGPRSFHIFQDPRYLKNARELARRTTRGMRVLGGTEVKPQDFRDCVAVGSDSQWGCTGTLIAPDVVVTAGHCAKIATRVFFGTDVSGPGWGGCASACPIQSTTGVGSITI